jgi:hypothetical protein
MFCVCDGAHCVTGTQHDREHGSETAAREALAGANGAKRGDASSTDSQLVIREVVLHGTILLNFTSTNFAYIGAVCGTSYNT